MYPVTLDLRGRACLVVGGGAVAARKVEGLLADGAAVTVVAPDLCPALADRVAQGRLRHEARPYAPGEAGGAWWLVFACTDDRGVNRQVRLDGEAAGRWVNVADDPELCAFHLPARLARGSLQVAVSTDGRAPFAARRLRDALTDPAWADWIDAAEDLRARVRADGLPPTEADEAFDAFFSSTVDPVTLEVSLPPAPEEPSGAPEGLVSLVGAGPGDPGLLTVRARRRLEEADDVVCDRLALPALPGDLRARIHHVGKAQGHHTIPQEEINALLVRLGREGRRVVRLKGGDPNVFGRGAEEAMALAAAGVPFEVVPGVPAAVAATALAGVSLTHRREAVQMTLVTAHESGDDAQHGVRWDLLARTPRQTLVGYMGVSALPAVLARLLDAGLPPDTPGLVVERGTTSRQRVVEAPAADLARAARAADLQPPALFVLGPTVARASALRRGARRPLAGRAVIVAATARAWIRALDRAGAHIVEVGPGYATRMSASLAEIQPGDVLVRARDLPWILDHPVPRAWCVGPEATHAAGVAGFDARDLGRYASPSTGVRRLYPTPEAPWGS